MKILDKIIGQTALKQSLDVAIVSAQRRNALLGHMLLSGGGGLGKTFIMEKIAQAVDAHLEITQGNRLTTRNVGEFFIQACRRAAQLNKSAFIIIDEIHEMNDTVQEELYYPMDSNMVLMNGEPVPLPSFSLAGATTAPWKLDGKSLVDRFEHYWKLEPMSPYDICRILDNYFFERKISGDPVVLKSVASRCHGNPRIAKRFGAKIRDYALYAGRQSFIQVDVDRAFCELGIDEEGLDKEQRDYLNVLLNAGKPVPLRQISNVMDKKSELVEKIVEPLLRKKGMIVSSSQGRELTDEGHKHLMASSGLAGEL